MSIRLTVVGCSGSYPGPESAASCYLLEADGPAADGQTRTWRMLLDLGSGSLGSLHRYADPLTIDAVVLSHLHPDHCMDLCGFYVLRKYHPAGAQPAIPVWGPEGTAARMACAYGLPPEPGMTEQFGFEVFPESQFRVGPFAVTAVPVSHPGEAFAIRVTAGGSSLAYSGDTGPCPGLVTAADGVDLLLAEAAFRDGVDNPVDLHLTGGDCGRAATSAGVGRLVLTHVPPWHDRQVALAEARRTWSGPLDLAEVGKVYEI